MIAMYKAQLIKEYFFFCKTSILNNLPIWKISLKGQKVPYADFAQI